ncbi:MAG: hypothetical protein LBQ00_03945 [Syntrophobacterales bacterium]|jgi:asparagine synthase (glutamine-hydrolysing)|nr:hypothetical protein [Syntrophobacterales bacterium]
MPGIVGIIGEGSAEEQRFALELMSVRMTHEAFHRRGTYSNEELGFYIGWVNHDGSFSDCAPIWNENKDICLIFSGEDFTDQADLEYLRTRGHEYDPGGAGYLVHLYEEHGLGFIDKLNGWFSGVVVDLREKIVALFNDRYGLNRIYYHERDGRLYFSSEAKSLLKVLPELRTLNLTSLAETFSFGCVLQNRTLFRGISLIPGGSIWTFARKQNVKKRTYFDPSVWEGQPMLSGEEYYERLKETFGRVIHRYRRGPNQVAMSLTGGLDGRLIMAWSHPDPGELPCYTFGGTYRDCTDVSIARKIARICNQPHDTIVVGPVFFKEFPKLAEKAIFISDGAMDITGSVELYVNRLARQIAPVRLTGNYGSEILRGNVAFKPKLFREELLDPEFAELVKNTPSTYIHEQEEGSIQSFIAFKQIPWHHYAQFSLEQSQLTVRSPYLDNEIVALTYQAPRSVILSKEPSLRLIAERNRALARIPTDRGLLYRPIPVIGKMHHLFQEFTVKSEYAYDYGMPQWLSKIDHMFASVRLERLFLGRHKFYHFRIWYRDQLSRYVRQILLDYRSRQRPYLHGRILEDIVNRHIKGLGNYTSEIHRLLTSELIQRELMEQ